MPRPQARAKFVPQPHGGFADETVPARRRSRGGVPAARPPVRDFIGPPLAVEPPPGRLTGGAGSRPAGPISAAAAPEPAPTAVTAP